MAISSTLTPTLILLLIMSLQPCTTPSSASTITEFSGLSCLRVSPNRFIDSANKVINLLQNVSYNLSPFTKVNQDNDNRLSNAISDCLELFDMAYENLKWSISATQNHQDIPGNKNNGTGNLSSDLRTWISAVLSYQETCIDGFEGTNSNVKDHVSGGLDQVISLVKNELLLQVVPDSDPSNISNSGEFPSWVKAEDEKLLQQDAPPPPADVVVAADGSGNYTTVMDAVKDAPEYNMTRYVIHVKKGIYKEYVEIKKKKWNIMIVGDGMDVTTISGNRSYGHDNITTFRTATFAVSAIGFIARDITFENTAGPENKQAVALRSDSDLSVFYRCGIKGYQDSLYAHSQRQFYKECRIRGTVDFICGNAAAVFQNCLIQPKKPLKDQKNTIAAQSRTHPNQTSGFSFHNCTIIPDPDFQPSNGSIQTFLGRPWKNFSRTVFMESFMSEMIHPEGWLEWETNTTYDDTLFFGEYQNKGPGSGVANRVKWRGYHVLNNSQAMDFTVNQFIKGDLWLPSTGVSYNAGLLV
ncbi:pectinesterase/pectinesterase inhibitor PPE8B-like [Lotus japonicus]|uniref:pectinesterase/pectinesterase inhibitor PPE8B-like n=1 Tax=Lotus japonicus TaxID=34305 RepID=UPI0025906D72|nr:pectinesterase/pectinesterase inhibitor PPE8B-like [Lotus japonicus]